MREARLPPEAYHILVAHVEEGLRRDFPHLDCHVWVQEATVEGEAVPVLVFEVRAATPPIRTAHTLINGKTYDRREAAEFVARVGEHLSTVVALRRQHRGS